MGIDFFVRINSIMFDNVGSKIKKVIRAIIWSEIVCSLVGGVILFFMGLSDLEYWWPFVLLAPLIVIGGIITAWLSNIFFYAFGELVENSAKPDVVKKETLPKDEFVEETSKYEDDRRVFSDGKPHSTNSRPYDYDIVRCPECGMNNLRISAGAKKYQCPRCSQIIER